ncbi:MAG: hypothetical protein VKI42_01720 [Synechococcaceae cyanobacterium]|nr:hypothetical protein [Synechococcaceae cyanobacterium]
MEFDPRRVGFPLFEGWDREQEAFDKHEALALVSGPMDACHGDEAGSEFVLPLENSSSVIASGGAVS